MYVILHDMHFTLTIPKLALDTISVASNCCRVSREYFALARVHDEDTRFSIFEKFQQYLLVYVNPNKKIVTLSYLDFLIREWLALRNHYDFWK